MEDKGAPRHSTSSVAGKYRQHRQLKIILTELGYTAAILSDWYSTRNYFPGKAVWNQSIWEWINIQGERNFPAIIEKKNKERKKKKKKKVKQQQQKCYEKRWRSRDRRWGARALRQFGTQIELDHEARRCHRRQRHRTSSSCYDIVSRSTNFFSANFLSQLFLYIFFYLGFLFVCFLFSLSLSFFSLCCYYYPRSLSFWISVSFCVCLVSFQSHPSPRPSNNNTAVPLNSSRVKSNQRDSGMATRFRWRRQILTGWKLNCLGHVCLWRRCVDRRRNHFFFFFSLFFFIVALFCVCVCLLWLKFYWKMRGNCPLERISMGTRTFFHPPSPFLSFKQNIHRFD